MSAVQPEQEQELRCNGVDLPDIVQRFCPVLHLHHKEKHFPCSAEWFLERSELRHLPQGLRAKDVFTTLAAAGEVTQDMLLEKQDQLRSAEQQPGVDPAKNLQLYIDAKHGHGAAVSELDDVPLYAHVKSVLSEDKACVDGFEINYMLLFAYNGTYPILGVPSQAGAHPGDWEHLTVRVTAAGELEGIWYNAHRNRDGTWQPRDAVPTTPCGRPIVYVALHGHGVYPTAGTQHRVLYAANDRTSETGPIWAPRTVVLIRHPDAVKDKSETVTRGSSLAAFKAARNLPTRKQRQEACCKAGDCLPEVVVDTTSKWTVYGGFWGNVVAPIQQPWYRQCEPPMSRTYWQRVVHFVDEKPLPAALKAAVPAVRAAAPADTRA